MVIIYSFISEMKIHAFNNKTCLAIIFQKYVQRLQVGQMSFIWEDIGSTKI